MNVLAKGWMDVSIGELIEGDSYQINNNKRKPLSSNVRAKIQGKYPYYGAAGVIDHLNDYKLEGFHLLIAEDGTVTSNGINPMLQLVDDKFCVSNHAHILKGSLKWETSFLYYALSNVNINPYITGAVQLKLSKGNLLNVKFTVPKNKSERKTIVDILSSFDSKIELLRAQNKTLEALAQTLFKEWFVKFNFPRTTGEMIGSELGQIPKGWRVGALGEEFEIKIGRTPPRKESEWFSEIPIGLKWVSIKDMGNSGAYIFNTSEYITNEAIDKFNIPIIEEGTTILSFKMTVGKLAITTERMLSNEAIAQMSCLSGNLSSEFIYCYLKNLDFNSLGSTSSIVTAINSRMIKDLKITIPNKDVLNQFDPVVKSIFKKIKNSTSQIQSLEKTRDALLPQLMNGAIRVGI